MPTPRSKLQSKPLNRQSADQIAAQFKLGGKDVWDDLNVKDVELSKLVEDLRTRKTDLLKALDEELKQPIRFGATDRGDF